MVAGGQPAGGTHYKDSTALYRELGSRRGVATMLHQLGDVAREPGEYARVIALFEESQVLYRELRDSTGSATHNLLLIRSSPASLRLFHSHVHDLRRHQPKPAGGRPMGYFIE